ncbi:MAG: histidine phosphatase family protein [Ignavibacterium sp.]
MKELYLLRHAKSSWDDPSLDDIERPLNNRGKKDAPLISNILAKMKIEPELILSSPSRRTLSTAQIILEELNLSKKILLVDENIYLASANELLDLLKNLDNSLIRVMLVGHNPGLTDLSNFLSNQGIENIPTCGIVGLKAKINSWKAIDEHIFVQEFFEYPKKYKNL